MATFYTIVELLFTAILVDAVIAGICFILFMALDEMSDVAGTFIIVIGALSLLIAPVITFRSQWDQVYFRYSDPVGYEQREREEALERANEYEDYFRVIDMEPGKKLKVLEDPNSGAVYIRQETGSGKSRAVETVPLLNPDGTPQTVEDYWRSKEGEVEE